ncbi:MAG: hypothetical protein ABI873_13520 [Marmoricola sp.]
MPDSFILATQTGRAMLQERMADTGYCALPRRTRDLQGRADAFLMAACRHVIAVRRVLVVELERHGDHDRARLIAHECHAFEVSMLRAKGRLYGATHLAGLPWHAVWKQVVEHFDELTALEHDAVGALALNASPHDLETLGGRMYHAEAHAPTRSHPFIPLRGWRGRLALAVYSRLDGVWDALEGRSIPALSPAPHA